MSSCATRHRTGVNAGLFSARCAAATARTETEKEKTGVSAVPRSSRHRQGTSSRSHWNCSGRRDLQDRAQRSVSRRSPRRTGALQAQSKGIRQLSITGCFRILVLPRRGAMASSLSQLDRKAATCASLRLRPPGTTEPPEHAHAS
eukprot:scaffold1830_cov246-Pinguiococcus_pyrenoidosus.AAC.9